MEESAQVSDFVYLPLSLQHFHIPFIFSHDINLEVIKILRSSFQAGKSSLLVSVCSTNFSTPSQ